MENNKVNHEVLFAMVDVEIAGKSVDGKPFTLDLTVPERKHCFDVLIAEGILVEIKEMPDPTRQGIVISSQSGVRIKSQTNNLVRVTSGWREKWEQWKKDNTGIYDVQNEYR